MKTLLIILAITVLSSCGYHTCPTYASNTDTQEITVCGYEKV